MVSGILLIVSSHFIGPTNVGPDKERTDALDLMAVAKDFSQANDRRRDFFDSF